MCVYKAMGGAGKAIQKEVNAQKEESGMNKRHMR